MRNDYVDWMVRSLVFVILRQPLSQAVSLNANNGIPLLVELRCAPERLNRYVVLLKVVARAYKVFRGEVGKQLLQARSSIEYPGAKNCFNLLPLHCKVRGDRHKSPLVRVKYTSTKCCLQPLNDTCSAFEEGEFEVANVSAYL